MFLSSWLESFKKAAGLSHRKNSAQLRKSRRYDLTQSTERLEERALPAFLFQFPPVPNAVISPMLISHSSAASGEPNFSEVQTDVPDSLDPSQITLSFSDGGIFGGGIFFSANPDIRAFINPQPNDITQFNDGFNIVRPLSNSTSPDLDVFQESLSPEAYVRFAPGSALYGSTTITVTDGFRTLDIPVRLNDVPSIDAISNVSVMEDTPQVSIDLTGITAGGGADNPKNNGQNRLVYVDPNFGTTNPFLTGIPTVKYDDVNMSKIGKLIINPVKGAPVAVLKSGDNSATITVTIEDGGVDNIVGKFYDSDTGNLTITNFPATRDNITRSVTFTFTVSPANDTPTVDDVQSATTKLTADNQVTDSSLTVADGSRFPPTANPNFEVQVENERMRVTSVVLNPDGTSTFAVTRAVNGTTIATHVSNTTVTLINAVVLYEDDLAGVTAVTVTGITAGGGSSPIGNEQQLVSITPVTTFGGAFTLTFNDGTHSYTSDLIPYDAPATVSRDETLSLSSNATGGNFTLTFANNIGAVTSLDDAIPTATAGEVMDITVDDTIGFPTVATPFVPYVISVGSSILGTLNSAMAATILATTEMLSLTNPITFLPPTPFIIQVEQEQMTVTAVDLTFPTQPVLTVDRRANAPAHNGSLANPIDVIGTTAEEMLVKDVTFTPVSGNPFRAILKVERGYHGTTPAAHPDFANVIEQRTTALNEPADLDAPPSTPLLADIDNLATTITATNASGVFPSVATDSLSSSVGSLATDTILSLNSVAAFLPLTIPFKILVGSEVMTVTSVGDGLTPATTTLTVQRAQDGTALASHLANDAVDNHFTIRVDREDMFVTRVVGTTLTVVRGVNGTSIAAHGDGLVPSGIPGVPFVPGVFPSVTQIDDIITVVDPQVLSSATPFQPYGIRIGSEDMLVTGVFGDQLLVNRGVNGTTIAPLHLDQSRVSQILTTGVIAYNADSFEIKNALAALPVVGPSGVEVLGGPLGTAPVSIRFINTLGKLNLDNLTSDNGGLTGNQIQRLQFNGSNFNVNGTGPKGGTYRLVFGGATTAPIPYDADAEAIQAALEALPGNIINPGDIIVIGGPLSSSPATIEFTGQYAHQNVPAISFPVNPPTPVNQLNSATLTNDERQQIDIFGATGGTFQLTFSDGFNFQPSRSFTTQPIQYDQADGSLTADNIESALQIIDAPFLTGVTVQEDPNFPFTRFVVTFSGPAGDLNHPQLIVLTGDNNLTPSFPRPIISISTLEQGNQTVTVTANLKRAILNPVAFAAPVVSGALSVHDALVRLQSVTNADIKTSGTSLPGAAVGVEFTGKFAGLDVNLLTVNSSPLPGPVNNDPLPLTGLTDRGGRAFVTDDVNGDGIVDILDRHFDGELQKLQVIAVSDNAEIVPDPQVIYVSPNGFAILNFTNNTDRFGEANITLTVVDSGFDQDLLTRVDNNEIKKTIHVTVKPTNDVPTINPLPDISIPKNVLPFNVALKGISAGGKENQNLKVTATSSNPALLADPSIDYVDGAKTATMKLSPIAGKTNTSAGGPSFITVVVEDAGVDGVLNAPPGIPSDNGTRRLVFRFDVTESPTFVPLESAITIDEDTPLSSLDLNQVTAGVGEGTQSLQFTVTNNNTTLFTKPNLYTTAADAGPLNYEPTADLSGFDIFHVTLTDAGPDLKPGEATALSANISATAATITVANPAVYLSPLTDKLAVAATGTDTTVTLSDVTPFSSLSVPFKIQIGNEVLTVTGTPTDKLVANLLMVTPPLTTITLDDASAFPNATPTAGYKIRIGTGIGAEVLLVTGKNGNVLQVLRAQDGTSQGAHFIDDPVVAFNTFTVIRGEDGTDAVFHPINDKVVQPFKIRIGAETLRVTGISGNSLTVTRGIDGTTAAAHLAQDVVAHSDSFDNLSITRDIPVEVKPVNDLPTLAVISPNPAVPGTLTIPEGSGQQIVSLSGISDGEGAGARQKLKVVAISDNPTLTGPITVFYTDGNPSGSIRFTPKANTSGAAVIRVTVFDGGSDNNLDTREADFSDTTFRDLLVTVAPSGDVPTINNIANLTINEDGSSALAANITNIQTSIVVVDGSVFQKVLPLTVQIDSEQMRVTAVSGNTLTVTRAFGGTTKVAHLKDALVLPAFGLFGITDNDANTQDLMVTVATSDAVSGQGILGTLTSLMADTELTMTLTSPITLPKVPFTIQVEQEQMTVTAIDVTVPTQPMFTVTRAVNGTSAEKHDGATVPINVTAILISNLALNYNPSNLQPSTGETPPTTGMLTFVPGADRFGTASIVVTVTDGGADELLGIDLLAAEVLDSDGSVLVANASRFPSAPGFNIRINKEEMTVTGITPDTLPGVGATFTVDRNVNGLLVVPAHLAGAVVSAPNTAADNLTKTRTINVTVNPVNDKPNITTINGTSVVNTSKVTLPPIPEGAPLQTVNLTGIDAGRFEPFAPVNALNYLVLSATSNNTALIPNPTVANTVPDTNATISFTPVAFKSGKATLTVAIMDGGLDGKIGTASDNATTTKTIEVTVNPVNDLPTLNPIALPNSTLASAVSSPTVTTITLANATAFPASGTPNFTIQVDNEQMTVTAVSGNTFTVLRNANGTTAAKHAAGAVVTIALPSNKLDGAMTDTDTEIFLTDASAFPASATPNFTIQVDYEQMTVTQVTGNNFTVVRKANGTVAATHDVDAPVTFVWPTGTLASAVTAVVSPTVNTITVANPAAFPVSGTPNFTVQVDNEQMTVTKVTGNLFTVLREANGTTAAAHAVGAAVTKLLLEDSGENSVPLTGITAGPLESQKLKVTPLVLSDSLGPIFLGGTLANDVSSKLVNTITLLDFDVSAFPKSATPNFTIQLGDEQMTVTGTPTNSLFAAAPIGALTVTLTDASAFPTATPASPYKIRIDSEVMLVTGKADNVLTVERAQDGTLEQDHAVATASSVVAFNTFTVQRRANGTVAGTPIAGTAVDFVGSALISHVAVDYSSANPTGTLRYTPREDVFGSATIRVAVEDSGPDGVLGTSGFLAADISDIATTVTLTNAAGFPTSATPNFDIKIGNEVMTVIGVAGNILTVAARPLGVAHTRGEVVLQGTSFDNAVYFRDFLVNVNNVADAPTLDSPSDFVFIEDVSVDPNVTLTGISDSDLNSQILSITATAADDDSSAFLNGTEIPVVFTQDPLTPPSLALQTAVLRFDAVLPVVPDPLVSGTTLITVVITDADGTSITKTFKYQVASTATNDPPTLDPIADVVRDEKPTAIPISISLAGIAEGPGGTESTQELTIEVSSDDEEVIPSPGLITYVDGDGTATFELIPNAHEFGVVNITVRVTDDDTIDGNVTFFERTFKVTINPVNDAPTLADGTASILENSEDGTEVLTLDFEDIDTPANLLSFSILSGNTDDAFSVDRNGVLRVANSAALDFETKAEYTLQVKVADNSLVAPTGLSKTATIVVSVADDFESLTIEPENWLGTPGLTLVRTTGPLGDKLHVRNSSTGQDVIPARDPNFLTEIVVNGRSNFADVLTLDYVGGDPVPTGASGLVFDGDGMNDTIRIVNAGFDQLETEFSSANSASITDPDSIFGPIELLGVETIRFDASVVASELKFVFDSASDVVTVSDDGVSTNHVSKFSSITSPTVFFPTLSRLSINVGNGDNSVLLNSLEDPSSGPTPGPDVTVHGGTGNDLFKATTAFGRDLELLGGAGHDTLIGGSGDDFLRGEAGNDALTGSSGSDDMDGGSGVSEINTLVETANENMTLNGTSLTVGLVTDSAVSNFQFAVLTGGSSGNEIDATGFGGKATINGAGGNDILTGSGNGDVLTGGEGDDEINGGGGTDTLKETGDVNFVLTDSNLSGFKLSGPVLSALGSDTLNNIVFAVLIGGASRNTLNAAAFTGSVTLQGGAENDVLIGGNGDDSLSGDTGNDTLSGNGGTNTLNGGADIDQVFESGNVDFTFLSPTQLSGLGIDDLIAIETAKLIGGDDENTLDAHLFTGKTTLQGGDSADKLIGGTNADVLEGGGGDDSLTGGLGDDTFNGGAGLRDTIMESGVSSLSMTPTTMSGRGSDKLIPNTIEAAELIGTSGNDTISGGTFAGTMIIRGLAGQDKLTGGAGDDQIDGGDEFTPVVGGKVKGDTISGGKGNDTILGGAGDDSISGGDGNDAIDGEAGNDTISGDIGSDILIGGIGKDSINGGTGADKLWSGAFDPDSPILEDFDIDKLISGTGADADVISGIGSDVLTDASNTAAEKAAAFEIDYHGIFDALIALRS